MNLNDAFGIAMALLLTYSGMACLSLAMPRHYDQVWGRDPSAGHSRVLRGAGILLLLLALLPCVGLWATPWAWWPGWAGCRPARCCGSACCRGHRARP